MYFVLYQSVFKIPGVFTKTKFDFQNFHMSPYFSCQAQCRHTLNIAFCSSQIHAPTVLESMHRTNLFPKGRPLTMLFLNILFMVTFMSEREALSFQGPLIPLSYSPIAYKCVSGSLLSVLSLFLQWVLICSPFALWYPHYSSLRLLLLSPYSFLSRFAFQAWRFSSFLLKVVNPPWWLVGRIRWCRVGLSLLTSYCSSHCGAVNFVFRFYYTALLCSEYIFLFLL